MTIIMTVAMSARTLFSIPVQFPEKGTYRGFVEFILADEAEPRVGIVDIEVSASSFSIDDFGWSKTQKWWILLIISILLTVPLVLGVRKYINVKDI